VVLSNTKILQPGVNKTQRPTRKNNERRWTKMNWKQDVKGKDSPEIYEANQNRCITREHRRGGGRRVSYYTQRGRPDYLDAVRPPRPARHEMNPPRAAGTRNGPTIRPGGGCPRLYAICGTHHCPGCDYVQEENANSAAALGNVARGWDGGLDSRRCGIAMRGLHGTVVPAQTHAVRIIGRCIWISCPPPLALGETGR
jgi:hypothetical protein